MNGRLLERFLTLKRRGWESPPPMLEMVETSISPRRVYQAIPERMWISSVERINGYTVDARAEIEVSGTWTWFTDLSTGK
jgi:hypothetical protein